MSYTPIISHIFHDGKTWYIQSNEDHCNGVACLAAKYAAAFGMEEWGRLIGLLHDRGKERDGFQSHIRKNSGYDYGANSSDESRHSFVGAVLSHKLPYDVLYWISNAIAGHHRGLYDIDELELILESEIPDKVSTAIPDIKLGMPDIKPNISDSSHVARMLFSCLVDADWLDTERFMNADRYSHRIERSDMKSLHEKLEQYLTKLDSMPSTPVNVIRHKVQTLCKEKSVEIPGFFELTVPTGGGKTIASIVFAINHALRYGKKRIIIAIPFTSIIVQTAGVLRGIFGAENVIEHHSAVEDDKIDERTALACENWDAPIIVTTNVQLFESMFSNKPSACRKLHSICDSVIIFDEIQTLPLSFLQPIVNSLITYEKLFGVTMLFCTASQPVLDGEHKGLGISSMKGIDKEKIRPIVGSGLNFHEKLRRVRLNFGKEDISIDTLADIFADRGQALCIVNTRRIAKDVYGSLISRGVEGVIHLSRMMCPAHIMERIEEIKRRLTDGDENLKVISTQLIEAGVDIDFPTVYRQMAGLDSILQAAGRCNREGNQEEGITHVFQLQDFKSTGAISFATDTMKRLLNLYPDSDWFDPETMRRYYRMLYSNTPSFDKESIVEMLESIDNCRYEECGRKFKLINDPGISVIVNYGDSAELVKQLKQTGPTRELSRLLGRYSVTVHRNIFNELFEGGLVEEIANGIYYIPLKEQYDDYVGLKTENEYLEIIMTI